MTTGKMLFAGIDIGSLSTEAVLLTRDGEIAGAAIVATGASARKACVEAFAKALAEAGAAPSAVVFTVSTGYGRETAASADLSVTEITCHARGARLLFPEARTVLDIGGQDSKIIRLTPDGRVADFAMNDKCAAGTGRFLEVMARTLEMDLEEMGPRSLLSRTTVPVSSMCTVFAESEVISLIASGTPPGDIARGIHLAIADRIAALAERVGMIAPAVMTGGVAKNPGVRKALEGKFGFPLLVPADPQLAGALGAALIAREKSQAHH